MLCKQVKPNHVTPSPPSSPKKKQQKTMPSLPSIRLSSWLPSARGLTRKQADWASKKYWGHHTLPEGIMEDLYKAQLP